MTSSDEDRIIERYEDSKGSDDGNGDGSASTVRRSVAAARDLVLKAWSMTKSPLPTSLGRNRRAEDDKESDRGDYDYTPPYMRKADEGDEEGDPSVEDTDDMRVKLPSNAWHKAVVFSTAGWVLLLVLVNSLSDAVFGLLFLTVWFLLPVGIYYDAKRLRSQGYAPPSYWWLYAVLSFVWFVSIPIGVLYLLVRRRR